MPAEKRINHISVSSLAAEGNNLSIVNFMVGWFANQDFSRHIIIIFLLP